jgi:hypothetical protein
MDLSLVQAAVPDAIAAHTVEDEELAGADLILLDLATGSAPRTWSRSVHLWSPTDLTSTLGRWKQPLRRAAGRHCPDQRSSGVYQSCWAEVRAGLRHVAVGRCQAHLAGRS